jgi:hypothetical protein
MPSMVAPPTPGPSSHSRPNQCRPS